MVGEGNCKNPRSLPRAARLLLQVKRWKNRSRSCDEKPSHRRNRSGFGSVGDSATRARRYSAGIHVWHYLDDKGVEHGPYSQQLMRQWHEKGYFQPTLMVRSEFATHATQSKSSSGLLEKRGKKPLAALKKTYMHLDDLFANVNDAFKFRASTCLEDKKADMKKFEYIDNEGEIHGPFPRSYILYWADNGMLPLETPVRPVAAQSFSLLRDVLDGIRRMHGQNQNETKDPKEEKRSVRALMGKGLVISAIHAMSPQSKEDFNPASILKGSPRGKEIIARARQEKEATPLKNRRLFSFMRDSMRKRRGSVRRDWEDEEVADTFVSGDDDDSEEEEDAQSN